MGQQQGDDPPTRAARLSYLEGAVSVQPAGIDAWTAAAFNRPLTDGDELWSDRGSRAEIDLGAASLRISASTLVSLLDLSDETVQLRVSAGKANITLRDLDPAASFEIDAPNAAVSLMQPGDYRIVVDSAGSTTVTLREGEAQVLTSAGQTLILQAGQGARFAANGVADVASVGPADEFDGWCAQRERRWARAQDTSQYVAGDVVGAQDLADQGEWRDEPEYGAVWYPSEVAADWAPYGSGEWVWVTPWGWSWVDSAPWGFAPFHYGRWAYLGQRWAWVPPPTSRRPIYAPALVAWIAPQAGGVAPAAGAVPVVGWLPLAPGEVYVPGYRVSPSYLQNVNVNNTAIANPSAITSVYQNPALQRRYANRDVPHALTVVAQGSFASGRPIAGRILAPQPSWQAAIATPRAPAIAPSRQSVLGPAAPMPVKRPPIALVNRAVIARHEPPSPPPPFERQLTAIRANGTRALPPTQLQRLGGADSARANVVVSPAPPSAPGVPVAPVAPATPRSTPIDRRVIPERAPQYHPPQQSLPAVSSPPIGPSQSLAPAPPPAAPGLPGPVREVEAPAAPPPSPPPPAPAQSEVKPRQAPPLERGEGRKVEPPP
jgi:hypothetical protein